MHSVATVPSNALPDEDPVPWGPSGRVVFERTYSRTKADLTKETWPETVRRVARGNLALVHGDDMSKWDHEPREEYADLVFFMERFAIIPAGRHLWATGATDYLFNCHVAGWGEKLSEHYEFSALRLFEGGGVGSNYSSQYLAKYGAPTQPVKVHIFAEHFHKDIEELRPYLSTARPTAESIARMDIHRVHDSREGWAEALCRLIDAAYDGSAFVPEREMVFDVTPVRPSGSELKTSGGTASGPAPLARMLLDTADILNRAYAAGEFTPLDAMEIDHVISEAVIAGGNRRSARMSIVRWDDPYIFDFINCKKDTGKHWTTNISVEVDDEFLRNLALGDGGTLQRVYQAKAVHEAVVAAMLENGEPGYWHSTLSAVGEVGEILATNPCGEIPLEAWENCNLGHVNLDYFAPKKPGDDIDWDGLVEAHELMTRFLIRATFGSVNDPKQRTKLAKNRRIGVGHLGVQGFWAKRGVRYSDLPRNQTAVAELVMLYDVVRAMARDYAFELRIPEPVKVTTVAPTGSIAKLPGVSEGIHPIYARHFERRIRFSLRDADQANQVLEFQEQGFKVEPDVYDQSGMTMVVVFPTEDTLVQQVRDIGLDENIVQSADEISPRDMLGVQALYQKYWADNAVSYTVNIPKGSVSQEELAGLLAEFLPGLKGTTIMVDESRPQAPYTRITREQYDSAIAKTVEDSTDESCASGACPVR